VVILKNGSLKTVLRVSGINFDLKSDAEQEAIEANYQSFLNTLTFPVQIIIQSRKLRLDRYISRIESLIPSQQTELLQNQTLGYIAYMKSLLEYANVMKKEFFIVVSYYPPVLEKRGGIGSLLGFKKKVSIEQTEALFQKNKEALMQRAANVVSALAGCGVRAISLNTKELVELFYNLYNPQIAEYEKLTVE